MKNPELDLAEFRAQLLKRLLLSVGTAVPVVFAFTIYSPSFGPLASILAICLLGTLLVAAICARYGRTRLAASILCFSLVVLVATNNSTGGDRGANLVYLVVAIAAAFFYGPRGFYAVAIPGAMVLFVNAYVESHHLVPPNHPQTLTNRALAFCVATFLLARPFAYAVSTLTGALESTWRELGERRKAEATLRAIFDSVNDAIFVQEPATGAFLNVNSRACEMFAGGHEQLCAASLEKLSAADSGYTEARALGRLASAVQGVPHVFEWHARRMNGEEFWAEVSLRHADFGGVARVVAVVRDISERKATEEKLKEVQDRNLLLAHALQSAGECIVITDMEERILYVNGELLQTYGYEQRELIGQAIGILRSDRTSPRVLDGIMPATIAGTWSGELWNRTKDGREFPILLTTSPVQDQNGKPFALVGFARDISERSRLEDVLRESEEKFRAAFMNGPDVRYLTRIQDGKVLAVNDPFTVVFGYGRDEVLGKTTLELGVYCNPEDRARMIAEVQAKGKVENFEMKARRKNGEVCEISLAATMMLLRGDPYIAGSIRDITQAKLAEERLRESEARFRSLADMALEGIMIHEEGMILDANAPFARLFGYDRPEELIGKNGPDLVLTPESRERIQRRMENKETGLVAVTGLRKDGSTFDGETDSQRVKYRGREASLVSFHDVTERKRRAAEKENLEEQLRQAQKLESIGRLAGGVAHDFNNLLTVINGYSAMMLRSLPQGEPTWLKVREISKAGERAAGLTKQLLAFSRKQTIQPKVLNLNTLIQDSEKLLGRLIGEDITLVVTLDPELGQVLADPDQIHQVLMNLAVNSRDAMPDGGRLGIETRNAGVDERGAAAHPDAVPGQYAVVTLSDSGSGMDAETMRNIFEPFFTTKELGRGTGLGLSTVYGIVRQSGGWIEVWSEVGKGTTFRIYLPRTDDMGVREPASEVAPGRHGGQTVLLVEDQESVLRFARAVLESCGYTVLQAVDGNEACALAASHAGPIELLVTDVVLPRMSGRELSERLQAQRPAMKALFMSGYTAEVIGRQGMLEPNVPYLQKPFMPDQLAAKVAEVLGATGSE